ncbi:PGPGW domain-containing protein [Janibacter sp. GS2]|uniref:PGPGW domain-containing protein n=1 Tax=Janibacter sp. GS2 TaxID=3442646 RepID=UPI003EB7888F
MTTDDPAGAAEKVAPGRGRGRTPDGERRSYRVVREEQHAIVRRELLLRFGTDGRMDAHEDPIRWRRAIRTNAVAGPVYRSFIAVLGGALIVLGLPMVPLVGPGWAVIFIGLFLWSTEFIWARRVTQFVKAEVKAFEQYSMALPWKAKLPLLCLSVIFGWFCFWLALLLTGVPAWTPDVIEDLLVQVPGLARA